MKITPALKDWHVERGASAEASDEEFDVLTMEALGKDLDVDKFKELTTDVEGAKGGKLLDRLEKAVGNLEQGGNVEPEKTPEKETPSKFAKHAPRLDKLFGEDGSESKALSSMEVLFSDENRGLVIDKGCSVRVKGIKEYYSNTRETAVYEAKRINGSMRPDHEVGKQATYMENGRQKSLTHPSEFEQAVHGAFIKMSIESQCGGAKGIPNVMRMTEHDNQLLAYAMHEMKWGGTVGDTHVKNQKLDGMLRKQLIDDATSGGINIAPITFDEAVILNPLLFGEFFPNVNTVPVTRGRRVEGGTISNVTLNSSGNQGDGDTITLETTASFIGSFNTNIFVVDGAIEIGLDFIGDSPVDIAGIITEQYGRVLMTYLDEQVAIGDGTTEPEGIMVASGTTSIAATNGNTGPPTVGDYEGLLFGVGKAFKNGFPTNRIQFGGSETSYTRVRGIAVGASDQRRVFGMNEEDYMLFGHPYGVGGGLSNVQLFFGVMQRYRMYRRMGLQILTTTDGKTLMLDNLMLITARARYGGQVEDGSAFAITPDAQT